MKVRGFACSTILQSRSPGLRRNVKSSAWPSSISTCIKGMGTAAIFASDARVFTLSVHGARNFPFRKQASVLDVELPDGTDDDMYLSALQPALDRVWDFAPQLLFFQSGVDGLAGDRLGRLSLTHEGLARRD